MLQMFALKMLFSVHVFVHAFRSPPDYLRYLRQIAGSAIYPPCYQLVTWVLKGKWQAPVYGKIESASFLTPNTCR